MKKPHNVGFESGSDMEYNLWEKHILVLAIFLALSGWGCC